MKASHTSTTVMCPGSHKVAHKILQNIINEMLKSGPGLQTSHCTFNFLKIVIAVQTCLDYQSHHQGSLRHLGCWSPRQGDFQRNPQSWNTFVTQGTKAGQVIWKITRITSTQILNEQLKLGKFPSSDRGVKIVHLFPLLLLTPLSPCAGRRCRPARRSVPGG